MLEKEIKLMLTEEEYHKLERSLEFDGELDQVNNYYYSAACSERRISIRVREVGGKNLLQIKLPIKNEGAVAYREELEKELPFVPEVIGQQTLSEICGVEDEAHLLGALYTNRKLCHTFPGVEICLDRNRYLGIIDYELEAEYEGEYPKEAEELLCSLGIKTDVPAVGKYSRFLKALRQEE